MTGDEELQLARRVEEGERAIIHAFTGSPVALRELAAIGDELAAARLRVREVLRAADEEELTKPATRTDLARLLCGAAALASHLESGAAAYHRLLPRFVSELETHRLHRRVLERVVGALAAAPPTDATTTTLRAVEAGRRAADAAKHALVEANLGLVVSFARVHLERGLELHDLVQEGILGLMKAVDKYDHRRGLRFSTYASWWVRQQMGRALADKAATIRLPVHIHATRQKVRRARAAFRAEHGREPTHDELLVRGRVSAESLRTIEGLPRVPISLQAPLSSQDDSSVADVTPDETTPAPDEAGAAARLQEQAAELLAELTLRERDVVERRFGFGRREETLEEIGRTMSLSRERIRQIELEALRKLRRSAGAKGLDSYLG